MLTYGIVMTLICVLLAIWPRKRTEAIEARIVEGGDNFLEEQLAYRSYPWLCDPKRLRIAGVIGMICGLLVCALEIYRP